MRFVDGTGETSNEGTVVGTLLELTITIDGLDETVTTW